MGRKVAPSGYGISSQSSKSERSAKFDKSVRSDGNDHNSAQLDIKADGKVYLSNQA